MDPAILKPGLRYLRQTHPRTHGVLVVRQGTIKSAGKALVSAAVGAALADGHLESLDQPVPQHGLGPARSALVVVITGVRT